MKLLTLECLAARWGVKPSTAMQYVQAHGVPFVSLSGRSPGPGRRTIRFRPESIDAWERAREAVAAPTPAESDGADPASLIALGWDGVPR